MRDSSNDNKKSKSSSQLASPSPGQPEIIAPLTVIDKVVPNLLSKVSPGDAPITLYHTTAITTTWFDAIAPYNKTTVGIHSNIKKYRGTGDHEAERNTSLLYASTRLLNKLLPEYKKDWNSILKDFGLDPSNKSRDVNTAAGIGNTAAARAIAALKKDGMNFQGKRDASGRLATPRPFADTTGYRPVNSADELTNPRRWQPDILTNGRGEFRSQIFATPQWSRATPYSYDKPELRAAFPRNSYAVSRDGKPLQGYIKQANRVLKAQAELTDRKKLVAEFYDDKIASLGLSTVASALHHQLSLEQFVQLDALVNIAAYDTGITIWENKLKYDSIRPFSAIRHIYGDSPIPSLGGQGREIADDITGNNWRPYLQSANHAEYPSATAGFAKAHVNATKKYLKEIIGLSNKEANNLSYWNHAMPVAGEPLRIQAGGSRIETGITPQKITELGWKTWDDFAEQAGKSRVWAGVHFPASIPAGQTIGERIGERAADWLIARIQGHDS